MAGHLTQYLERALLDHVWGNTAYTTPGTLYLGLFTVSPSGTGGGTEVSGGSYARASLTNNTTNLTNATSGSPASKTTGVTITFTTATADWGEVVACGWFDASSGGNLLDWEELLTGTIYDFTAKASSDTFTSIGHGLANGDKVRVSNIDAGGSGLPTGIVEGTNYFVVGTATDTFQLSATSGGAAINITADGAGLIQKTAFKTVSNGDSASVASGAWTRTLM